MIWREFAAAAEWLHGNDWRPKLSVELYEVFRFDELTIARWEQCLETIPLHVELVLRSRLFVATSLTRRASDLFEPRRRAVIPARLEQPRQPLPGHDDRRMLTGA
jgi:hypothetical protein